MLKDNNSFKERFQRWRNGEQVYENGRPIPHYADGTESDNTRVVNPKEERFRFGKMITDEMRLARSLAQNYSEVGPDMRSSLEKDLAKQKGDAEAEYQRKHELQQKGFEIIGKALDVASLYPLVKGVALGGKAILNVGIAAGKKMLIKPVKLTSASKYNFGDAFDMTKNIENDVAARYYLSGAKPPKIDFVYHGRGTNRGNPEEVLRNYSKKDVGLHVSPRRRTAEPFAHFDTSNPGVLYEGVDINPNTPDFVAGDLGIWDAENWANALRRSELLTPELEKDVMERFPVDVVDKDYSLIKSIRDIADYFGIDKDYVKDAGRLVSSYKMSRDYDMIEDANAALARELKEKGVKFDYMNAYEGGGYRYPSRFISDPSDIWWSKQIFATPHIIKKPAIQVAYKNPFIKDGELLPADEEIQTYIFK